MGKDITGTGIQLTEHGKIDIYITKFQVSHQWLNLYYRAINSHPL